MGEPDYQFLRYRHLRDWLEQEYKILEPEVKALIARGEIKPIRIGGGRPYYSKRQVLREVLRYEQAVKKRGKRNHG